MSNTQPLPVDLTRLLAPYCGEWVALSVDEKRVLGHGKTLDAALEGAKRSGEERPIIIRVPDQFSSLLLWVSHS